MFICNKLKMLAMLAAISLNPCPASAGTVQVVRIEKSDFSVGVFEDFRQLEVIIREPIAIKPKGLLVRGETWATETGVLAHPKRATIQGREYALIPVDILTKKGRRLADGVTNCGGSAYAHIAVDVETQALLNYGFWLFPDCPRGNRQWLMFHELELQATGQVSVNGFRTQADADAAAQRATEEKAKWEASVAQANQRREEQQQAEEARKTAERKTENTRTLNAKRKVGARLCNRQQDTDYIGYTESVSPDNNKLKVRISHAYIKGTRVGRQGFTPIIVWEDPSHWQLCE